MCLNSRKIDICAHQLSLVNYAMAHTQVTCTSIRFHGRLREGKDEGIALEEECFAFAYKKKFIETCLKITGGKNVNRVRPDRSESRCLFVLL